MLEEVKLALRITTSQFDDEITMLIQSALLDLGIAGVITTTTDSLIKLAVITYVKMHFGNPENYDRLKKSYDEQKAQLQMATGYTSWGDVDG